MLDDNIIVYHGTCYSFKTPDLTKSNPNKDFGKGFYLTTDRKQAIKFAKSKAKRNHRKEYYLNTYKLSNLNNLNVVKFDKANPAWFECVSKNRTNYLPNMFKGFEVIIGKVADDDTSAVFSVYTSNQYGKMGSKSAVDTAIKLLKPEQLKDQICIRSKKGLNKLSYIKTEVFNI